MASKWSEPIDAFAHVRALAIQLQTNGTDPKYANASRAVESEVSRICADRDIEVGAFRDRTFTDTVDRMLTSAKNCTATGGISQPTRFAIAAADASAAKRS